ncbi:hypothetical protein ACFE04_020443 [Oxalis oulophora]
MNPFDIISLYSSLDLSRLFDKGGKKGEKTIRRLTIVKYANEATESSNKLKRQMKTPYQLEALEKSYAFKIRNKGVMCVVARDRYKPYSLFLYNLLALMPGTWCQDLARLFLGRSACPPPMLDHLSSSPYSSQHHPTIWVQSLKTHPRKLRHNCWWWK